MGMVAVAVLVCFTSDFGASDGWVGVCHAVIHQACPAARVVDLSHEVPPFDVRKGAAVAAAGAWQLPEALHLAVVDPGVGAARRDLIIVTGRGTQLVGPDNGILVPATWRLGGIRQAYAIVPRLIGRGTALATFHARDVLAPAVALLACGVQPGALAAEVEPSSLANAPFERGRVEGDSVQAEVIDIDRYGSLRVAADTEMLASAGLDSGALEFVVGHARIVAPFAATFADVAEGEPVALIDSSGWLTIAVRLGSAAERYGVEPGTLVRVRRVPSSR